MHGPMNVKFAKWCLLGSVNCVIRQEFAYISEDCAVMPSIWKQLIPLKCQ